MQGYELVKAVENEKTGHDDRIFIKWWRKENDFVDFDLVDHFLENLNPSSDIGGFELITQEQMWEAVQSRCKGCVTKVERDGVCKLLWEPPVDAEFEDRQPDYPYTPEMLLKIMDVETGDNYVD